MSPACVGASSETSLETTSNSCATITASRPWRNKCWIEQRKKYKYGLLTKCEVKMAGYWPRFMDRDGVEVHKHAKKERGRYQAILTEQAWSIKDLLYGIWGIFLAGQGG